MDSYIDNIDYTNENINFSDFIDYNNAIINSYNQLSKRFDNRPNKKDNTILTKKVIDITKFIIQCKIKIDNHGINEIEKLDKYKKLLILKEKERIDIISLLENSLTDTLNKMNTIPSSSGST